MSLSLSPSFLDLARRRTSDVLTRIQSHLTSSTLSPLTSMTLTWFSQQLQRVQYILHLLQQHPHRSVLGILCITGGIMSMRWIIRHVITNKIQDEKVDGKIHSSDESLVEITSQPMHRHNNNNTIVSSMTTVSALTSSSISTSSSSISSSSSPSTSRSRICHFYNRSRGCRLGSTCDHLHICKICRSTQHQAFNCTYPRLAAAASNHGVTFAILSPSPSTSTSTSTSTSASTSTFTLPSSSASLMSASTSTSVATVTPTRFSQSTPLLPWPAGIPPFTSHTTPKSSRTPIDSSHLLLSTPIPPAPSDVPMPSFLHTTTATTTTVATSTTSSSPFSSPCLSSSCPCGGPYARSLREHSCHEHPTFGCRHLRHYYKLYEQLLHTHQEDESRHIEWKHVGKLRNLKETAVKYVIAMGNAEGGVLKFGIDEKSDRVFGISFSSRYRMTKEDVRRELSSTMKQFTNTQPNGYHLVFVPVVDDHIRIRSSSSSTTIPPLLDDDSSSDDTDHKSGTDADHDEPEHLIDEYGKYTKKTYICPCTQKSIDGLSIPLTSLSCGCPCRCSCRCRYVLEIHIRPSPYALYMHGAKKNVLETYLYADAGVHTYTNESVHLFIHNHAMRRQLQQSFNYQALLQRAQELVTTTSTSTSTYENEEKQQLPSSPHITPSRELTRIQQQHLVNVMSPPTSTHTIRMITGPIPTSTPTPTPTKTSSSTVAKKKKTQASPAQTNTSKTLTATPSSTTTSTSNLSSTSSSPTTSPVSSPSTFTRDLTYSPSQSSNTTSSPLRSRLPRSHRLRSRLIRSNLLRRQHKQYRISIVFLFFMILIIVMPIALFYYRPDPLSSSSFFEHEGDFYGMCPAEQEQIITINHTHSSQDVPFFIAAPTESTIVVGRCIHPRLLYQSPTAVAAPETDNSTTATDSTSISPTSSSWFHSLRTLVDHLFQLFQSPSQ